MNFKQFVESKLQWNTTLAERDPAAAAWKFGVARIDPKDYYITFEWVPFDRIKKMWDINDVADHVITMQRKLQKGVKLPPLVGVRSSPRNKIDIIDGGTRWTALARLNYRGLVPMVLGTEK